MDVCGQKLLSFNFWNFLLALKVDPEKANQADEIKSE
jgi:hypothetical protein